MSDRHWFRWTLAHRPPLGIVRYAVAAMAVGLLAAVLPAPALAAPTGTISCSVVGGDLLHGHGLQFRPYIALAPRANVTVRATNTDSACDNSGVTGGKAPIVEVLFKFIGKIPNGTCTELTTSPEFVNARVKLKWRGLNPANRLRTVAVSKADLASASFDGGSGALILTTQPIAVGAFTGATATLYLGIDDVAGFESDCTNHTTGLTGVTFGQANPSTVDVQ